LEPCPDFIKISDKILDEIGLNINSNHESNLADVANILKNTFDDYCLEQEARSNALRESLQIESEDLRQKLQAANKLIEKLKAKVRCRRMTGSFRYVILANLKGVQEHLKGVDK
jgi:hypothetical protein